MGVKQSGENPFQLKVGERPQPPSKVGHFSLQIKKRNSFGCVYCRGMQKKKDREKERETEEAKEMFA